MKYIPGYEGAYSVTEDGKVWSHHSSKFLAGAMSTGYKYVLLCKDGVVRNWKVHRLVALTYIGARLNGMVVDHIDRDPLNNSVSNLRYVTASVNLLNNDVRAANAKDDALYAYMVQDAKAFKREMLERVVELKTSGVSHKAIAEQLGLNYTYVVYLWNKQRHLLTNQNSSC